MQRKDNKCNVVGPFDFLLSSPRVIFFPPSRCWIMISLTTNPWCRWTDEWSRSSDLNNHNHNKNLESMSRAPRPARIWFCVSSPVGMVPPYLQELFQPLTLSQDTEVNPTNCFLGLLDSGRKVKAMKLFHSCPIFSWKARKPEQTLSSVNRVFWPISSAIIYFSRY